MISIDTNVGEIPVNYPKEFRDMCLMITSCGSDYCIPGVIRYLLDKKEEVGTEDKLRMEYAAWIDHFFMTCLYPLEGKMQAWTNSTEDIELLLNSYETTVGDLFAEDRANNGQIEACPSDSSVSITSLAQRINVYFYTLHLIKDEQDKAGERLTLILSDTEKNVAYLLGQKEAQSLFKWEWTEDDSFYYPTIERWQEPLSWIYHESDFLHSKCDILSLYSAYVSFLKRSACLPENETIREALLSVAARRLSNLYESVIEDLKDDLIDPEDRQRSTQTRIDTSKHMQKQTTEAHGRRMS